MAEFDRGRVAAVFAADTAMQLAVCAFTERNRHLHKFADADGVETCKRVGLVNLCLIVAGQELTCVVTAEAERHLSEVVGAEAEEVSFFCDFVSGKSCSRDFNHSADFVFEVNAAFFDDCVCGFDNRLFAVLQFFDFADERNHNFRLDFPVGMTSLNVDSSLDNRFGLHNRDFGISNRKTASSVTHHRVELVQAVAENLDFGHGFAFCFCKCFDVFFFRRNEFVKRRVQETNGNRHTLESFHKSFEVCLLHRLDCVESFYAFFNGFGANHLAEFVDSARSEEHMFGTDETDTLCAEFCRSLCVGRRICVCANAERFIFVCEFHNSSEVTAVGVCRNGLDDCIVDVARRTVEGETVAFAENLACEFEVFLVLVHLDVAATGNAAGSHSASNNRRVRGLTAANGKDALCVFHTFDVLGRSLESYENDFLACFAFFNCVLCGKYDCTCGSARRCCDTFADDVCLVCFFECFCVKLRVEQHIESLCVDLEQCFLLCNHTLVDEVASDTDCSCSSTFTVSGLKHIEFLLLNGKLHILHISVVVFQNLANVLELSVHFGKHFCHLGDRHRGANACDDVLALCVHKEFAHKTGFARCGVTSECNARAAIVAHIAERHHLYVDCGTPAVRDVVVHTIDVCARVVPRTENCFDSFKELFLRVGRERFADFLLILCFELACEFFEVVCGKFYVVSDAFSFFEFVDKSLKILLADFHNDVGEHLDKTSVAVPRPSCVAGLLCQHFHYVVVEAEVEDCVHHTGHRRSCARTNGNEKRIFFIAEFHTRFFFEFGDVFHNFRFDVVVDLFAVLIVLSAGFGSNRETVRNGETDVGHFRKVCAFTAEKFTHFCIAFGKLIYEFFAHLEFLLKDFFV